MHVLVFTNLKLGCRGLFVFLQNLVVDSYWYYFKPFSCIVFELLIDFFKLKKDHIWFHQHAILTLYEYKYTLKEVVIVILYNNITEFMVLLF